MLDLISNVLNLFVALNATAYNPSPITFQRKPEEFRVLLGRKVIYKEAPMQPDTPVVYKQGDVGRERYLLLESYFGDSCPATYTLLTFDRDDQSREFHLGNCDSAHVEERGNILEIYFPGYFAAKSSDSRAPERWVYEDGELRRLKD